MNNQVNVDIKQTQSVKCEECGGIYFEQALVIRKASGLLTGTGNLGMSPSLSSVAKNATMLTGSSSQKKYNPWTNYSGLQGQIYNTEGDE